tara:strand:- start:1621 stop:2781 length:1161 start_codon:yes stop_codon:yes gene_type:complete
MNINSNLIKLLISILIIIFIYNCINLTKLISIEGFETMTKDDIELLKKSVNELKEKTEKEKTAQNIKDKIKIKDIYENENVRLYLNYTVKDFYLKLFTESNSTYSLDNLKQAANDEINSLHGWIYDTVSPLYLKIFLDVFIPIKDTNEDKLLFKKLVNELSNEIGLNNNNNNKKATDITKMDKINEKTEKMLDVSNIDVSTLFLDADVSNSNIYENADICLKHMNDRKKSINFDEYIYLLKYNPLLIEFINKLLKNAKKTTENIKNSAYETNKSITEINKINKKNREEYLKKKKEHEKNKNSNEPEPDKYKTIDVLTATFIEKQDLAILTNPIYNFIYIVQLLRFKKIFNKVKDLNNEYKIIIEENISTNQMLSDKENSEEESSWF